MGLTNTINYFQKISPKIKILKRGFQKSDIYKSHGDNRKILKLIKNYKFKNFFEAIKNTHNWFRLNKDLYKYLNREDNFSDRLTLFLLHFSFFLKNYKNDENKTVLQEIYDFNFRQLELSIREIGYGDQSINKKMKDYINLFHSMVSEIHFWEDLSKSNKLKKISIFLNDFGNIEYLLDYFEKFNDDLSKKTLNSFLKSVSNP